MTLDDEMSAAGYELLGDTRVGGTSVVYRARRVADGATVAVKIVDADRADHLRREVDIGRRASHVGLSLPTESGQLADGRAYVVAPWVDGVSLSDLLRRRTELTQHRVLTIADDIVGALDALHRAGIVHRDVSPGNIILGDDQRATLIDIGLGRVAEQTTVTASRDLAGTPRYLAPEAIRGDEIGPAADQYSLAVVLYEQLTGSWPFPATTTAATALHHQLHTSPTPMSELDPSIDRPVADAIERALAKDPDARWPDIGAFGVALHRERLDSSGWSKALAVAAGAGILAATAVAGVFAVRGDDTDAEVGSGTAGAAASADVVVADTSPADTSGSAELTITTTVPITAVTTTTVPTTAVTSAAVTSTVLDPPTFDDLAATFPESIPSTAPAGAAAALDCNLLLETAFESGFVVENFFNNPDSSLDGAERVIEEGGVDGSGVLVVGEPGRYGLYGVPVPIAPGTSYEFSAAVAPVGTLFASSLLIGWLDADFSLLDEAGGERSVIDVVGGRTSVVSAVAPPGAAYAVPQVYKDNSPGVLLADELVFAAADDGCNP